MICLIYSVHPSREQARASAGDLLDHRLAACCNILPPLESHYVWQGTREQTREYAMVSKTTEILALQAIERLKTLHPYDCPAVLKLPVTGGNPAFMAWIDEMCKPPVDQAK